MSVDHYVTDGDRSYQQLNNETAQRADLFGGPSVVMPSKHLMAPSDANEVAVDMELADQHLADASSSTDSSPLAASPATAPQVPDSVTTTDEFALAFDIDGVLMRGGKPIPAAVQALKYINGANPYGVRV